MGVFKGLRKKDEVESSTDLPAYTPNDAASAGTSAKDEELGQQQAIQTGWSGDAFAGANEYPQPGEENYKTLGRWRAA